MKHKKIFIACPWTPLGGGMFKVADYLIQSQTPQSINKKYQAELSPLDTRGNKHPFLSIFYLSFALIKLLFYRLKGEATGIHVNMAERLSLFRKAIIILFSRLIGVPIVLHLHAAQLHHFYAGLPRFMQTLTRWTFSKANRVIVLGETAKQFVMEDLKVKPESIEIVLNGVPEPVFKRTPHSVTHNKVRVMFLGNLSERKGVSDLLNAMSISQAFRDNKAEALFVGDGNINFYKNLAKSLNIEAQVTFTGWADQKEAAQWMATADVLALPSYDEGLPLVILEALGSEVAVLCTPVGEIPHNLTHNQDAVFIEPGNVDNIGKALDKLALDIEFRKKIAYNGRKLYENNFSLDYFSDHIAEIHQQVFGVSSRPNVFQKGLQND